MPNKYNATKYTPLLIFRTRALAHKTGLGSWFMSNSTKQMSGGFGKISVLETILNDKRALAYMFLAPAVTILCFIVVYPFISAF
jgi:hypothetical protein